MNKTYAFIGNLPDISSLSYNDDREVYHLLLAHLRQLIVRFVYNGATTFYSDVSVGYGMWCFEILLSIHDRFENFDLIAVIPDNDQHILTCCKDIVRTKRSIQYEYMVRLADTIIILYDEAGPDEVTRSAIQKARELTKEVIILNPNDYPAEPTIDPDYDFIE